VTSSKPPTYGDLLTILESAERQALEGGDRSTAELLTRITPQVPSHTNQQARLLSGHSKTNSCTNTAIQTSASRNTPEFILVEDMEAANKKYQNTSTKYVNLY